MGREIRFAARRLAQNMENLFNAKYYLNLDNRTPCGPDARDKPCYSQRNATRGSTRIARLAGT